MSIQTISVGNRISDGRPPARATTPILVPVGPARARVLLGGRIIGHVDDVTDVTGRRFRASRYRRASGALVPVGEFSRRSDAIDALRFAS